MYTRFFKLRLLVVTAILLQSGITKAITAVEPEVAPDFVTAPVLPFHDIVTTIYHLSLNADYRLNKQMRMRLGYIYEYFSNDDWAFNNIDPTTIDILLTTGKRSPNYTAHVVGLSLIYDF